MVEDWVQHPEADRYEFIDGILSLRKVHENRHEYAVMRVGHILVSYLDQTGTRGEVYGSNTKYRVRLRHGIMPDVSIMLGERVEAVDPSAAYIAEGPDLAVEILSPEQGDDYVEERLANYRLLGTREVWFINPWQWIVVGYSREGEGYVEFAQAVKEEQFSSRLLDGLSFSAQVLWPRRRASSQASEANQTEC